MSYSQKRRSSPVFSKKFIFAHQRTLHFYHILSQNGPGRDKFSLMSFWDRLRALVGSSGASASTGTKPLPTRFEPSTKQPVKRMINSITLSSDMETLYLIDNGRAVSFSLLDNRGILIGLLGGQLTVVSAVSANDEASAPGGATGGDLVAPRAAAGRLVLPIATRKQWTVSFNQDSGILAIIGATDIDSGISGQQETKAEAYIFKLQGKAVQIRRRGATLEAALVDA
jgi:hypothetical protein